MSATIDKVSLETTLFLAAFAVSILGAVFLGKFLFAMVRRAGVKRYLRERACEPIKIRWIVLAWWWLRIPAPPSVWVQATAFRVTYSDPNRRIHKAYCWVGYDVGVMVAPLWSLLSRPIRTEWVKDEIIGEPPAPEVWVNDEIITKKLKADSQTDEPPGE